MEHPHSLLQLVIKQHYRNQPKVLESLAKVLQEYSESKITYQETLSNLFPMLNGLPSDIVLYYLSTVPLPKNPEVKSTSILPGLMKQMLTSDYHNRMRPVLLKYLNDKIPPLVPLSNATEIGNTEIEISQNLNSQSSESTVENKEIRSVIDDNISQEKIKKKAAKIKSKMCTKISDVKPLSLLCANNIYKNLNSYCSKYKKQKREAWRLVNSNKCDKQKLALCYDVIKDVNKKVKWLDMVKTGKVSKEIIEEEYGKSDVFYLERNLQSSVSEEILDLNQTVLDSIDVFLNKC